MDFDADAPLSKRLGAAENRGHFEVLLDIDDAMLSNVVEIMHGQKSIPWVSTCYSDSPEES